MESDSYSSKSLLLGGCSKLTNENKDNQLVLAITCAAFAVFVCGEIVGALASNSLSLLGDAAAMSIDV